VGEKNTTVTKVDKSKNLAAFSAESRPWLVLVAVLSGGKDRDHHPTAHREDKHVAISRVSDCEVRDKGG
jgi:hypothetical protein